MGRPTKLTSRVITEIVNSVCSGVYLETAAAFVGVSASTLRLWLRDGSRLRQRVEDEAYQPVGSNERLFVRFSAEVEKALAAAEMRHVLNVGKHAETEWTASAWWLERRNPDRWGRRSRLDVGGVEGAPPVQVEATGLVIKVVPANDPKTLTEIPRAEAEGGEEKEEAGRG